MGWYRGVGCAYVTVNMLKRETTYGNQLFPSTMWPNTSCQAWQQMPLPTEPCYWPEQVFFKPNKIWLNKRTSSWATAAVLVSLLSSGLRFGWSGLTVFQTSPQLLLRKTRGLDRWVSSSEHRLMVQKIPVQFPAPRVQGLRSPLLASLRTRYTVLIHSGKILMHGK